MQGFETFHNSLFKNRWEVIEEHAQGDGQFDAFMNALAKIYKSKELQLPKIDYAVRIPPGSSSDALCETIIT
jgi:D-citramalate synthase